MSMIRCNGCDGYIDTDDDCEGLFEDAKPYRYWCSTCVQDMNDTHMLQALQAQDPALFAELTGE